MYNTRLLILLSVILISVAHSQQPEVPMNNGMPLPPQDQTQPLISPGYKTPQDIPSDLRNPFGVFATHVDAANGKGDQVDTVVADLNRLSILGLVWQDNNPDMQAISLNGRLLKVGQKIPTTWTDGEVITLIGLTQEEASFSFADGSIHKRKIRLKTELNEDGDQDQPPNSQK